MGYRDFDTHYANIDENLSYEVCPEAKGKTVIRRDLIANVVPKLVQLMLNNAKWHPPKKCDWIYLGKNRIATWEMYRIEPFTLSLNGINFTINLPSINLMPMQVPTPEFCKTPNGGLIWVSQGDDAKRFQDYVNLDYHNNVVDTLCLKMINFASNFGISAEEIDGITHVLFQ